MSTLSVIAPSIANQANNALAPPGASARPRLALALGSGGVRSIAALGMAQVLMREGIKPDLVVGCSAGALFGAVVAAGFNPSEAVALAQRLWSPEVTRQRRWGAIGQMLWPGLLRFNADFSLRRDELIMQRLHQVFGQMALQDLPTPLRVVATETTTGQSVVLSKGSVAEALRASIALPFMFSSKLVQGQRLSDGFLSNPLPVDAAADAHAVLALGFFSPLPKRINGPSRLLAQVSCTMINNLTQARLAQARASGQNLLALLPTLERRVGLFDTAAMGYLVEVGRQVTQAHLPQIQALIENQKQPPQVKTWGMAAA